MRPGSLHPWCAEASQNKGTSQSATPGRCRASYCEIYNEAIYDLLNFTNQQLSIRWDAVRGFHVPDLFVKECAELQDLLQVRFPACRRSDAAAHHHPAKTRRCPRACRGTGRAGGGEIRPAERPRSTGLPGGTPGCCMCVWAGCR